MDPFSLYMSVELEKIRSNGSGKGFSLLLVLEATLKKLFFHPRFDEMSLLSNGDTVKPSFEL
jgi:hypothetical protein